ncbi:hypothetical protein IWW50_000545 [Coemansia erecta]|nr:hypothetical protein IWW50_000545 [Coemansia erecta]
MRPDPYKQKASRRYQATHKSVQKADAAPNSKNNDGDKEPQPAPVHRGGKYSRRQLQDNAWRYEDNAPETASESPLDTVEAAEAREEDNVREFLSYLEEKSQNFASDQSAVYFQLRAEADSAELDSYNDDTWKKLVEINWDGLVDAAASMPLRRLLDVDNDVFLPETVADTIAEQKKREPARSKAQTNSRASALKLSAADLAPGVGSSSPSISLAPTRPTPQPPAPPAPTAMPNVVAKPTPMAKPVLSAAPAPTAHKIQPPAKSSQSVDELEAFLDEIL